MAMRLCTRHLLALGQTSASAEGGSGTPKAGPDSPLPSSLAPASVSETLAAPLAASASDTPAGGVTPLDASTPVPNGTTASRGASPMLTSTTPAAAATFPPSTGPLTALTAKTLAAAEADFDIALEASKIPLDVAIFESINATQSEERMRRLVANLVIVGGTAKIHNAGFAIQSRLAVLFAAQFPAIAGLINVVPLPVTLIHPFLLGKVSVLWAGLTRSTSSTSGLQNGMRWAFGLCVIVHSSSRELIVIRLLCSCQSVQTLYDISVPHYYIA